jgi:hypothetical protein
MQKLIMAVALLTLSSVAVGPTYAQNGSTAREEI